MNKCKLIFKQCSQIILYRPIFIWQIGWNMGYLHPLISQNGNFNWNSAQYFTIRLLLTLKWNDKIYTISKRVLTTPFLKCKCQIKMLWCLAIFTRSQIVTPKVDDGKSEPQFVTDHVNASAKLNHGPPLGHFPPSLHTYDGFL